MAAGQSIDGGGVEVHALRLPVRVRRRRAQRPAGRCDDARIAEVALAQYAAGEVIPPTQTQPSIMKYLSVPVLLLAAEYRERSGHAAARDSQARRDVAADSRAKCRRHAMSIDRVKKDTGAFAKNVLKQPTCCALALGGSTLLVADAADRHVWAFRIEKDGTLGPGDRYCRLQVRGDQRRTKSTPPEAYRADPSAMTVDGFGRCLCGDQSGHPGVRSDRPTMRRVHEPAGPSHRNCLQWRSNVCPRGRQDLRAQNARRRSQVDWLDCPRVIDKCDSFRNTHTLETHFDQTDRLLSNRYIDQQDFI